ncbi:PTS cellobiose transporter subunit IIC [Peribacillus muralis]|uniref:PTS cellobiose transporter subunit IIC n=1 Tax=Peribacillus muralis TaxID=264697 RepID=UPI00070BC9B6|nr:PTS cellobiose transporter subunit IIC [Peribacillus muralis]
MSKYNSFLENKVMPIASKMAGQRHLLALRDGIILTMPLIIIGSLFLILGFIPIPGYNEFMASIFGDAWMTKLLYPVGATYDIMALIATFGIAYRLAEQYKVDPLSAGAVAVSAFLIATPYFTMFTPEGTEIAVQVGGVIPVTLMGSKGLFVGILIALFSTEIYRKIIQKNIVIKMPEGVPPSVSKSFVALIPAVIVISSVWLIRIGIENLYHLNFLGKLGFTNTTSLHDIITLLLSEPLGILSGSLIGAIIYTLLVHLLWVCGLHGSSILGGVMTPILLTATDQNRLALQAGEELPNIVTSPFFELVFMGGSGVSIVFVVMMVLFAKSEQSKQLGKIAIAPSIFNINEPVVFGAPVVMNPLLMIPFILTPVVLTVTTYIMMKSGFIPLTNGTLPPWTTPPIISGFLATGSWKGSLMQIINLVIAFAIYLPFFKMWDKQNTAMEKGTENINVTKAI